MKFEWDELKNKSNILKHGIDFEDAYMIFDNPILSSIDGRVEYNEERIIGIGILKDVHVVIVYTIRNDRIRVISIRKANIKERTIYNEKVENRS